MLKIAINEFKKYKYKLDLLWLIVFILLQCIYFVSNNIYKDGFDLTISLDRQIPLISIFVFPYIFWYLYMIIGYILISLKDRKEFMRVLIGQFIGMLISYSIFFIFPTKISRPIISNEGILNTLINTIYLLDRPFNCFPSLHVLGTYFIMRYTKKNNNKYIYYYTQVVGVLIIFSTVFIKQHFVLDVITSIIMVEVINILIKRISDEKLEKLLKIPYLLLKKITSFFNRFIKKKPINKD